MRGNKKMVKELQPWGVLGTPAIKEAFLKVDRKDFVLDPKADDVYADHPLSIGHNQTISQPYTVAFMLELLQPQLGEKILDVGSGSGWVTALLSEMVGPKGQVRGVERVPELVKFGQENLAKYNFLQASIQLAGDSHGLPEEGPYDKILVSAAAEKIPEELVKQLKPGGKMILPVQNELVLVEKQESGKVRTKHFPGFLFVPLK